METWKIDLTARVKNVTSRDIFQVDTLLPLLFVIEMMPLNYLLKK